LLLQTHDVMACQAAFATASLREVLKAGPLCRQRTLDPKKIPAMAMNSTRPERGTSLILYRGVVVMPRCSSRARSLSARIEDSAPKDSISVHLLVFGIARGRVLFVGLVFCVMVFWLLLLLSRRVLSHWALRNHQLYLERFLFW
jgi:hypothetical protein